MSFSETSVLYFRTSCMLPPLFGVRAFCYFIFSCLNVFFLICYVPCLSSCIGDNLWTSSRCHRVSSSKVYSAVPPPQQVYSTVPPPQQLLAGAQNSGSDVKAISSASLTSTVDITPTPVASLFGSAGVFAVFPQGNVSQSGGKLNGVQSRAELVSYAQPLASCGTYYNGYGGIYPQATPMQQVALALRQSSCPVLSNVAPTTSIAGTEPNRNASSSLEKRSPQKRRFQEGPIGSKSSKFNQVPI